MPIGGTLFDVVGAVSSNGDAVPATSEEYGLFSHVQIDGEPDGSDGCVR